MLVIPVPHVTRLSEATGSLIEQLYMTAGRVGVAMRRAFDATGTLLFQQYQIRAVERASAELPK
jgi:diadenosine tetraphosphate (Ap4A) HIT family hydrolase